MNDTMTGITAPGRGILRGKIRRGMVTALMLAAIVGGALLPVNSAQAHFDYCGKEEYEYSVYFKEVYREEKDEAGKRWDYYD